MIRSCQWIEFKLYTKSLASLMLFSLSFALRAQVVINAQFNDKELENEVILSYFEGDSRFVVDTIAIRSGRFKYESYNLLPGVYTLIADRGNYTDFLLADNVLNLDFHASLNNLENTIAWTDQENLAFHEYRNMSIDLNGAIAEGDMTVEEARSSHSEKILAWHKKYNGYTIESLLEAKAPLFPENSDIRYNSALVERFWSNSHLELSSIKRTPFLKLNLNLFFDNICPPVSDSIIHAINILFNREIVPEVSDYIISYLTHKYESSKIMGMDAVFVHMVDKFYRTGRVKWESDENLSKIINKSNQIGMNLISKKSPNFEFLLLNGTKIRLYDIKSKYKLLVFYDPDCTHCREVIPEIQKHMGNYSSDQLSIIGIDINSDTIALSLFVENNGLGSNWIHGYDNRYDKVNFRYYYYIPTTPTLILLSEGNTIVAKGISPEKFVQFISL